MSTGLDSRAILNGGATEGFGNLGAALLMAPQMRRKLDMEAQQRQQETSFQDRQLAQALGMHQDQMGVERERTAAQAKWHTEDAAERAQAAKDAASAKQAAGSTRGVTPNDLLKQAHDRAIDEVGDPNYDVAVNPQTGLPQRVPRSPESRATMQPLFRAAVAKHLKTLGLDPMTLRRMSPEEQAATAADGADPVVQARQAANGQVRQQQRANGQAAGVDALPGAVNPPQAQAATAFPSGPKTMTQAQLQAKATAAGWKPEDAAAHYQSQGWQIAPRRGLSHQNQQGGALDVCPDCVGKQNPV